MSGSPLNTEPGPARWRPWLLAAPLAGLVAVGLGAAKLTTPSAARPAASGEGLRIEVVQPAPTEITPGSRMDVGELVDGYRHVAVEAPRPTEPMDLLAWLPSSKPAEAPSYRPWRERDSRVVVFSAPMASEPRREERRGYGFQDVRRELEAAREARRERLERMERRRMEFERRMAFERDRTYNPPPDRETRHADDWRPVQRAEPPPWRRVPERSTDPVYR